MRFYFYFMYGFCFSWLFIWRKKFLFLIGHYVGFTLGLVLMYAMVPIFPFALLIYILLTVLIIREVLMIKNYK